MGLRNFQIPTYLTFIFIISHLMSTMGTSKPWNTLSLPPYIAGLLRTDPEAIESASHDFGNIITKQITPAAVLYPSSAQDIANLINFSYNNNNDSVPFNIAARGQGHSVGGQAMAYNGVIVNMTALKSYRNGTGVEVIVVSNISGEDHTNYADVGGEQLWIDVLNETLKQGLAPVSWTDYLYLTVGGTLSNAGISGQTFRYGPQITNVHELDVVTGKGELVTCSTHKNSDLFHAVLGGLGQFGIITRARIGLQPAPKRVKWVRMLYSDFSIFTGDQESLISINGRNALDYLEGSLLLYNSSPDNWRSSFFNQTDHPRIISLTKKHEIIYCLEIVKYFDDNTQHIVDKELQLLVKGLSFIPGFMFQKDESYVGFLNRARIGKLKLKSQRLWDVPHPWLNLFVPKSRILDFNNGVFKDIVLKQNITKGHVIVYPMNTNKWDDKMSAVIPEEDVFYTVGFLHSSRFDDWEVYDNQNKDVMQFCETAGIKIKQYLPHYLNKEEWIKHFGSKWNTFRDRKARYDPKMILSPGQKIFNM